MGVWVGGRGEAVTMGIVTSPGLVTGKVVPETTIAVVPGGTEVTNKEVICMVDVLRRAEELMTGTVEVTMVELLVLVCVGHEVELAGFVGMPEAEVVGFTGLVTVHL